MEASQPFRLTTSVDAEQCLHLAVHGEVDLWTARATEQRLSAERNGHPCVVIALRGVTFIGAAGASLLVKAQLKATIDGQRLQVVDGPEAHRLLEVTGLLTMLEVVEPQQPL